MTTIEKIKAEIQKVIDAEDFTSENAKAQALALFWVLELIDKYAEQEPCDDVIDRAEAMTEIMMFAGNVKPDEEDIYIKVSDAVQLLRELPPVRPQEKTWHWIKYGELYQCSKCKELSCCQGKFCNECGAKMVEPQESEG